MSTTANKTLSRRFRQEQDKGNWAIFEEIPAPDCTVYFTGNPEPLNRAGLKQLSQIFFSAFPDLRHMFEDQVAEGDKVVNRITLSGTHQGEFQGIPPTGRSIAIQAIVTDRFVDGKLVECWGNIDSLGMLQQLGVIPTPEAT